MFTFFLDSVFFGWERGKLCGHRGGLAMYFMKCDTKYFLSLLLCLGWRVRVGVGFIFKVFRGAVVGFIIMWVFQL